MKFITGEVMVSLKCFADDISPLHGIYMYVCTYPFMLPCQLVDSFLVLKFLLLSLSESTMYTYIDIIHTTQV